MVGFVVMMLKGVSLCADGERVPGGIEGLSIGPGV